MTHGWMNGWMRKDAHRDFHSSHKDKNREAQEGKCDVLKTKVFYFMIIKNQIIISQTAINKNNNNNSIDILFDAVGCQASLSQDYVTFTGGAIVCRTNKPPVCHLNFEPACPSQNNMSRVFVTDW